MSKIIYSQFFYLILIGCFSNCIQNNATTSAQIEHNENENIERQSVLTIFSREQYLQDFNQLVNLLSENHPQLNQFISKEEYDVLVGNLKKEIVDEMKIGEFIWLCRNLIAAIGCGHSVVPTLGLRYDIADSLLFPVKVNYIDNQLFVIDPFENEDRISRGDEIKTVNGIAAKELKNKFFKHISADANNKSLKMERINNGFSEYAAFEFKFSNNYEIELLQECKLVTKSLKQIHNYTEKENNPVKCASNLCYEVEKDLAIITISSFYYYRENFETFKKFIDDCFTDIKDRQIENLIIDLRNNGGGDPYCGSYLLQHIANKKYQYYKTGTYSYADLQKDIEPNPNRFKGKPYILINGRCGSTTGQLCALIKENHFGIFVGQETGATFRCNASTRSFTLENTKINPFIATRTFESNVKHLPNDQGILPDHPIKYDISNLLNKEDVTLIQCKRMIKN